MKAGKSVCFLMPENFKETKQFVTSCGGQTAFYHNIINLYNLYKESSGFYPYVYDTF